MMQLHDYGLHQPQLARNSLKPGQ